MVHYRSPGALIACFVLCLIGGCSFPGYVLEPPTGETWHVDDGALTTSGSALGNIQPVFHSITPELIARMRVTPSRTDAHLGTEQIALGDPSPQAYKVGKGDLLAVIVFGHPDLTNPAGTTQSVESSGRLVDAEGEIFMPFIGELMVEGQTVDQIRTRISDGLQSVINNPQVDVRVIQFRSQSVVVLGDLPRPCRVPIRDTPLTLVEALEQCQSFLVQQPGQAPTPDVNAVQLIRGHAVERIVLSDRYRSGAGPVYLRDGDRIVIDDRINRVFLVGEFARQAAVPFSAGGMNLADAMAAAGGLALDRADAGGIYVIRGLVNESGMNIDAAGGGAAHVYHLNASSVEALLLADQFELRPRDVVFAAPASLVNFNRALGQLTPSLDILLRSAILFTR
jgi:polysaccharide export outer membrane protein